MTSHSSHSTITIVILTHRADPRFINTLSSASWADQIIILDHHTQTDWRSVKIPANTTIIDVPKVSDFSVVRNSVWKSIATDWVLFLDSDEVITKELRTEIRSAMKREAIVGVSIPRRDIFLNQALHYGEVGNIRSLRLCRAGLGDWKGKVHEVLHVTGDVTTLNTPILHYPHQSIAQFVEKVSWYARLRAEELSKTKQFSLWQAVLFPLGKLVLNLVVKQGLRDGYRGIIYALVMSIHSLAVRANRYELEQKDER